MRSLSVILVVIAYLICGAAAIEPSQTDCLHATAHDYRGRGRKLRAATDAIKSSTPSAEQRDITALFRRAQVQYWVKTGKTEDYVKKALKLDKFTGRTLKTNPKYKYYEAFLLKTGISNTLPKDGATLLLANRKVLSETQQRKVNKWLGDNLPTFEVWKELRLSAIPEANRVGSDAYNVYVQFAVKYDDELYRRMQNGEHHLIVIGANTPEEMYVRTKIWAERERPENYVKKLLGMESSSETEPAYKYYKQYIDSLGRP